jgi:hypothetical protein
LGVMQPYLSPGSSDYSRLEFDFARPGGHEGLDIARQHNNDPNLPTPNTVSRVQPFSVVLHESAAETRRRKGREWAKLIAGVPNWEEPPVSYSLAQMEVQVRTCEFLKSCTSARD